MYIKQISIFLLFLSTSIAGMNKTPQKIAGSQDFLNGVLISAAAQGSQEELIANLIFSGANVNSRNQYGLTALGGASQFGRKATVELLLANGAIANDEDAEGKTPLLYATTSQFGTKDIIILLLNHAVGVPATSEQIKELGNQKNSYLNLLPHDLLVSFAAQHRRLYGISTEAAKSLLSRNDITTEMKDAIQTELKKR